MMKCGHLFSGIGGFALAAQVMGWENVFHCDIDPFANKVMAARFPGSQPHGDIKKETFYAYNGTVELISGGFPCQPISKAGKRRGSEDERWLWPEMLRAITEIVPRWVVAENVANLVRMGIEEICADLAAQGYETQPFIIPALAADSLTLRDRVWIIGFKPEASNPDAGSVGCMGPIEKYRHDPQQWEAQFRDEQIGDPDEVVPSGIRDGTDPRIFGMADGLPDRVDRLKAIGNAIDPRVAIQIFSIIQKWELSK